MFCNRSPSCGWPLHSYLISILYVQHSIFFYNLVSCCLAINIVVHWALKALLTVLLLPEQLFERLCNILWCCVIRSKSDDYILLFFPSFLRSSGIDPGPGVFEMVHRIHDDPDQQMYSCGLLAPKMWRGGCMDSHYHKPGKPWEKNEVWDVCGYAMWLRV